MNVDEALQRKSFLYSVPYSDPLHDQMSGFLQTLRPRISVGAICDLSSKSAKSARQTLDRYAQLDLRIADPQLQRVDAPCIEIQKTAASGKQYATRVPREGSGWDMMLADEIPVSKRIDDASGHVWSHRPPRSDREARAAWIQAQFDLQRSAGANVLLSAGGWVRAVTAQRTVKAAMNDVADSRAVLLEGEVMLCALTLHHQWLADRNLLSALLTEVRSSDEPYWYLRFLAPKLATGAQLAREDVLTGLMTLANAMEEEGKRLLLPNLDLLGTVSLAGGAAGFSTTTSASKRYYVPAGGGSNKQRDWKFEPEILRVVTRASADALRSRVRTSEYFETPFHQEIDEPGFDRTRSKYDHVASVAMIAAETAGPRGRDRLARRITRGMEVASDALDRAADDFPSHLERWARVLN